MTITLESFVGKTYGAASFEPLVTKGGIDATQGIVSFKPLTTRTLVQGQGNRFLPLVTLAADRSYGAVSVSFESLITDGNQGIPNPVTGNTGFSQLTTSGFLITGGLMTGDVSFEPLVTLATDRPYGEASVSFEPMAVTALNFPTIDNWMAGTIPAVIGSGSADPKILNTVDAAITAIDIGVTYTGGQLSNSLGAIEAVISATIPVIGRLNKKIPAITASGDGRVSSMSSMTKKIGGVTSEGHFGGGLNREFLLGINGSGSVINGSVSQLAARIPPIKIDSGEVSRAPFNILNTLIPAVRMVSGMRLSEDIPAVIVSAHAAEVLTAQFATYAMNLENDDGLDVAQQAGFALTSYNNFPFIEIVRFGNKNYGVSKDGIFLLEGETDDGAPIAWQFDPFLSDFGSSRLKTISAAYAGGRIYGGVTYNLSVEEDKVNTYTFVTPRDSTAQNYRQVFGKGVRTRYVGVGISDPGGSDFNLESLNLEVNDMKRSI